MAITLELSQSHFMDHFRHSRPDNFSYEALEALFNYYEELSDELGSDIPLDVIAVCLDWSEMTLDEMVDRYAGKYSDFDALSSDTTVLKLSEDSALVMSF